jgi:hypothetical protein
LEREEGGSFRMEFHNNNFKLHDYKKMLLYHNIKIERP